MAAFRNNNKKDWNSHKTGLVFVHDEVFKDKSRNSGTFKMELFATIGNGRAYSQWTVFASLMPKLKSDEKGYALNAASDMLSCFVDMLSRFFENANFFLFH